MNTSVSPCAICGKCFVNVALHHTKTHAVFSCVTVGDNRLKIFKDGECITTLSDMAGADGYDFYETMVYGEHGHYKASDDGKTYRLKMFHNGKTELWLTTLARGNGFLGGKDTQMITANVNIIKKRVLGKKPLVAKSI